MGKRTIRGTTARLRKCARYAEAMTSICLYHPGVQNPLTGAIKFQNITAALLSAEKAVKGARVMSYDALPAVVVTQVDAAMKDYRDNVAHFVPKLKEAGVVR